MQLVIRHEANTIAIWAIYGPLPEVNDAVVVKGRAYKVLGRNWAGPDEMALVVE